MLIARLAAASVSECLIVDLKNGSGFRDAGVIRQAAIKDEQ